MSEFTIISTKSRLKEVVDNSFFNYSEFQVQQMELIGNRLRFEYFITHGHCKVGPVRKPGPVTLMWREAGKLHAVHVGMARVLAEEVISDS